MTLQQLQMKQTALTQPCDDTSSRATTIDVCFFYQ